MSKKENGVKFRILIVALVVASFSVYAKEVPESDIAAAEEIIAKLKVLKEADKRTHSRVVQAIAETNEGKIRMATCKHKYTSYKAVCFTDDWKFKASYDQLYDKFYVEELKAVLDER